MPANLSRLFFTPVDQRLVSRPVADLSQAVARGLACRPARPGERIAVAAGSRGIHRIGEVVRLAVAWLREQGALPFVVPAMGSHGGATAAGQAAILEAYGITEAGVGAPLTASMETVLLGDLKAPFARAAAEADGIVIINRVKPHTSLAGQLGSGLRKMMAVGLGHAEGARALHAAGLAERLPLVADSLLHAAPVRVGLALVEDGRHQLAVVQGAAPDEFIATDGELLRQAREWLPGLPFDPLDGAVFVHMGKNIAGTGMDPNVIGRHRRVGGPAARTIGVLTALRLTAASHGNGTGIGMADIVPQDLVESLDHQAMEANARANGWPQGAAIPAMLPTEAEVIARACQGPPESVRAVIAHDTGRLDRLLVTPALLGEVEVSSSLAVSGPPAPLCFDAAGRLTGEF